MLDTLTGLCYYGVCTIVVRWAFCALWPVPLAQSQRTTVIFVFLRMGSEPSTLIENVFRFLSVEGGAMALIKSVKTVKGTKSNGEIQHNDEPEQDDEEVQG